MPAHEKVRDSYEPLICTIQAKLKNGQLVDIPASEFLTAIQVTLPSRGVVMFDVALTDAKHSALMTLISLMEYGHSTLAIKFGRKSLEGVPVFEGILTSGNYTISPESISVKYQAIQAGAPVYAWDKNKPGDFKVEVGTKARDAFAAVYTAMGKVLPITVHQSVADRTLKSAVAVRNANGMDEPWIAFMQRLAMAYSDATEKQAVIFILRTAANGNLEGHVREEKAIYPDTVIHRYTVAGDPDGEVVSFQVDDNSLRAAYTAVASTDHKMVDSKTGITETAVKTDKNGGVDGKAEVAYEDSTWLPQRQDGAPIVLSSPDAFGPAASAKIAARISKMRPVLVGTLTVRGTHDVQPFDAIDLTYAPYGFKGRHFLSCTCRVTTVIHSFSSSGWLTQFQLYTDHVTKDHPNAEPAPKVVESAVPLRAIDMTQVEATLPIAAPAPVVEKSAVTKIEEMRRIISPVQPWGMPY